MIKQTRQRTNSLRHEALETRALLTANPVAEWGAASQIGMIGEEVSVTVAFDNVSGSATGFAPYAEVLLPESTGGISLVEGSVSYLGSPAVYETITLDADGRAGHPLAVDANGEALTVVGQPGDRLLVVPLPFGGFVAEQPAQAFDFRMTISPDASLDDRFNLETRGGFRLGATPLDDPATDPSMVGPTDTLTVIPSVFDARLEYLGPEDETATGPTFGRTYRAAFDAADGQVVSETEAAITLADSLVVTGVRGAAGAPVSFVPEQLEGGGQLLRIDVGDVVGTLSRTDAAVEIDFYVAESVGVGAPVLEAQTGDDRPAAATLVADARWLTAEGSAADDEPELVATPLHAAQQHSLSQQSIAVQEYATVLGRALKPGATIEFRLDLQVSDFFAFDDVTLRDTLADGLRFDESFVPLLSIGEGSAAIDDANYTLTEHWFAGDPLDGSYRLEVRVSDELRSRGDSGHLLGAEVASLTFRAIVQDEFAIDYPSGEAAIDEGDRLRSDAEVAGVLVNPDTLAPTGFAETDGSGSRLRLPVASVSTSVYAINGQPDFAEPRVAAGDTVTFRITRSVLHGDVEDLVLDAYLPLPLVEASEANQFTAVATSAPPAAGIASLGPADTLHALTGATPNYSVSTVANRASFDYGDLSDALNRDAVIDLLVTVTATDTPFADGLLLTEHAHSAQATTNAGGYASNALTRVIVAQPVLEITKGIAPAGDAIVAGLDTDLSGLDAGDPVRVVVTVTNSGSSHNGAFDVRIRDDLAPGLNLPDSGTNLTVTYADGTPVDYAEASGGLFGEGIELIDGVEGSVASGITGADRSAVVISYDAVVAEDVPPGALLTSEATITRYAGIEGGANRATPDLVNPALVAVADLDVDLQVIDTGIDETAGTNVAIGEVVTYRAVVTVPEGRTDDMTLVGTLARGMAIESIKSMEAPDDWIDAEWLSSALASTLIESVGGGAHNAGRRFRIPLGDVVNGDRDNAAPQQIVVTYDAVVTNFRSNDNGDRRWSRFDVTHASGSARDDAQRVRIVEPKLEVSKQYGPDRVDAGDTVAVRLRVAHTSRSEAEAHELLLTDLPAAGTSLVEGSLRWSGEGVEPSSLAIDDSGAIRAAWTSLDPSAISVLEYEVWVADEVAAGQSLASPAELMWSGLSGVPGVLSEHNAEAVERDADPSSPGGSANDYVFLDAGALDVSTPRVSKQVIASSAAHTEGSDVAIGEAVTYEIEVTVPEGAHPFSITDVFPAESFELVAATVTHVGSSLLVLGYSETSEDGLLSFDFGQVTNTPNGVVTDADRIRLEVTLAVEDADTVSNRHVLVNRAVVDYGLGSVGATAGVWVVEPDLVIDKRASASGADALDVVHYTITIGHGAGSTSDAFDLTIADAIDDDRLQLVEGTLTSSAGSVVATEAGGIELSADALTRGETFTIEFDAIVSDLAFPDDEVTNVASAGWTSLPDAGGRLYSNADVAIVSINSSTLAGSVFVDADGDAAKAPEELGLCEMVISLEGVDHLSATIERSTISDCQGRYEFGGLRPGEYAVRIAPSDEYVDGPEHEGALGGEVLDEAIEQIVIPAGSDAVFDGNHFTKRPWSVVAGAVFDDADNDGTRHCEEPGVAGVVVTLAGINEAGAAVLRTAITADDGSYSFGRLRAGAYTVTEQQPDGWLEGATGSVIEVGLAHAQVIEHVDFAEVRPATLSGFTYIDLDRDGVDDTNDAQLAGVMVALTGIDDLGEHVARTTLTGIDGGYEFAGLRPGEYALAADTPDGLLDGRETIGSFDGLPEPIERNGVIAEDAFGQIDLLPGDRGYNYNFGELEDGHLPGILADQFERTVVFVGSGGDDAVSFEAGSDTHRLVLNGAEHVIDASESVSIRYYAGSGDDSVTITGTEHEDRAELRFGSAKVTGTAYEFRAYSTEEVTTIGGGGEDRAYFYDTPGDEVLTAGPSVATFASAGRVNVAEDFHRVYVYATAGSDHAQLVGSEGRDTFKAEPGKARLYGAGFYNCVHGFDRVDAVAAGDGDRAHVWDSAGDDAVAYDSGSLAVIGEGLAVTATGFSRHDVYAIAGGRDEARLLDSPGDDRFRATPLEARLDSQGVRTVLHQFEAVAVDSTRGGDDRAQLHDSACEDELVMAPGSTRFVGHNFDHTVAGFDRVYATATLGATDRVTFRDSTGADTFKADSTRARLYGDGFDNSAEGFERVTAIATGGGDRAYLTDSAGDDVFVATTTESRLYGEGYSIAASGFDRTYATASSGGRDRAFLFDADGDASTRVDGDHARMVGDGYVSARDFECNDTPSETSAGSSSERAWVWYALGDDEADAAEWASSQPTGSDLLDLAFASLGA